MGVEEAEIIEAPMEEGNQGEAHPIQREGEAEEQEEEVRMEPSPVRPVGEPSRFTGLVTVEPSKLNIHGQTPTTRLSIGQTPRKEGVP